MKMPTNKVNTKQVIYVTTLQLKKKNHTKVCNLEEIKPAHKSNNLALKIQKKNKIKYIGHNCIKAVHC